MPICIEASTEERSQTIPQGSRAQASPKRPDPKNWGYEIVESSWKREAALKTLVKNMRISDKGCWEWTGATTVGYGSVRIPDIYGSFKIMTHRLSLVAFKGAAIPDGLFVCHRCDNPVCFNPDHLFLGTQQDNLIDCSIKGRTMTGEKNGNSKYTKENIQEVLDLFKSGKKGVEIVEITGISATHICRIRKGYTWKHETASAAELAHHNRKYTDEQIIDVAKMIKDQKLSNSEIAKITNVNRFTVIDIRKGKSHQRFMKRATE